MKYNGRRVSFVVFVFLALWIAVVLQGCTHDTKQYESRRVGIPRRQPGLLPVLPPPAAGPPTAYSNYARHS